MLNLTLVFCVLYTEYINSALQKIKIRQRLENQLCAPS